METTALTEGLLITDNGATAAGELIITGLGGGVIIGEGNLFDIVFRVAPGAALGAGGVVVRHRAAEVAAVEVYSTQIRNQEHREVRMRGVVEV